MIRAFSVSFLATVALVPAVAAQNPSSNVREAECTYDLCALALEGNVVRRGIARTRVGKLGLF